MKTTKSFNQQLDDLFRSIDAANHGYFTARAEQPAKMASAPVQKPATRPAAPRVPASGELKFQYRELAAGARH